MVNYPPSESIKSALMSSEIRQCWVCFATDEEDRNASWVHPCKCMGSLKWVHQRCIQRWIDEKQRGNAETRVGCPQCKTIYVIIFPDMGFFVNALDLSERFTNKCCPFVAAGVVVGTIYWAAVTYGAVTVMQVLGQREGMTLMESADPLILLLGLPSIPVGLVMGKMIRWEDSVLKFVRSNSRKIPLLRYILPSTRSNDPASFTSDIPPAQEPISATRTFCSALFLPTAASLIGNVLFPTVNSNLKRTLLGGAAFLAVKGLFTIYHKQKKYIRQCGRQVMDYSPSRIAIRLQ